MNALQEHTSVTLTSLTATTPRDRIVVFVIKDTERMALESVKVQYNPE